MCFHVISFPTYYARYTITKGISTGKLVGGSLTLITAMIGTPHQIDFTDAIVCVEDVEEAPSRYPKNDPETFGESGGLNVGSCLREFNWPLR